MMSMRGLVAGDVMVTPPTVVRSDASLDEVARTMLERQIGSVLVVDERGLLVGIVTETDFAAKPARVPFSTYRLPQVMGRWMGSDGLREIYREARSRRAEEIMTPRVFSVEEATPLARVLELMLDRDITHVPVLEDGRPAGIVARHDLLRLVHRQLGSEEEETAGSGAVQGGS